MRELTKAEIDRVSGAALQLGSGALVAGLGGLAGGARYAVSTARTGGFSWGGLAVEASQGAVSGFLIGTGATLVGLSARGVMSGAHVAGVSMIGAGAATSAASGAMGQGGGSE
ncbi:MAG: hypothetical protein V2I63_06610 [Pseudomonadales bacterium]|nr:hypothetical protein [Pseudomonadales bacterium]